MQKMGGKWENKTPTNLEEKGAVRPVSPSPPLTVRHNHALNPLDPLEGEGLPEGGAAAGA
jgi:hypothetical protein